MSWLSELLEGMGLRGEREQPRPQTIRQEEPRDIAGAQSAAEQQYKTAVEEELLRGGPFMEGTPGEAYSYGAFQKFVDPGAFQRMIGGAPVAAELPTYVQQELAPYMQTQAQQFFQNIRENPTPQAMAVLSSRQRAGGMVDKMAPTGAGAGAGVAPQGALREQVLSALLTQGGPGASMAERIAPLAEFYETDPLKKWQTSMAPTQTAFSQPSAEKDPLEWLFGVRKKVRAPQGESLGSALSTMV